MTEPATEPVADRAADPPADPAPDQDKPGFIERLRARYPWFDHVMRANERYNDGQGNFFAAGLSYYTIFALFPILMLGFAVGGFLLSRQPHVLADIEHRVKSSSPGAFGDQLVTLIDTAIASRTSVGVIGLAVAGWAGLNWMTHLREALSQMWVQQSEKSGFVRTKLSDLVAMLSAFLAIAVIIALTALGDPKLMAKVLGWLGVPDFALLGWLLRIASLVVSVLIAWLLFTWMIARLPREPISFAGSLRAGAIAAIAFELFKQVGSIYLRSVVNGPAGVAFGPVLGLMVFAYITVRLILFATAWAATTPENMRAAPVGPPNPAVITPRVLTDEGLSMRQALAATTVGAVGALGLSRLLRWRKG